MSRPAKSPRLFTPEHLAEAVEVALSKAQAHYLISVMRLRAGESVRLFNGEDGEWSCQITQASRKGASATCCEFLAASQRLPDIDYLFAPLKSARLDYMAQKATEMGVRRLRPVFTERTVPSKVNTGRLHANVIEAAEQCNMVAMPQVLEPKRLQAVLADWEPDRHLIYCDEAAPVVNACERLGELPPGPVGVLIGPEGGFSPAEQTQLRAMKQVVPISLGPRIMRADTAAVAALTIVQSVLGDLAGRQQS